MEKHRTLIGLILAENHHHEACAMQVGNIMGEWSGHGFYTSNSTTSNEMMMILAENHQHEACTLQAGNIMGE